MSCVAVTFKMTERVESNESSASSASVQGLTRSEADKYRGMTVRATIRLYSQQKLLVPKDRLISSDLF